MLSSKRCLTGRLQSAVSVLFHLRRQQPALRSHCDSSIYGVEATVHKSIGIVRFTRNLQKELAILAQVRLQPVSLEGEISLMVSSQASLQVHYYKRDEVYFTTYL